VFHDVARGWLTGWLSAREDLETQAILATSKCPWHAGVVIGQRGNWTSSKVVHDQVLSRYLQKHELVSSAGYGASMGPYTDSLKGKIFVTNLRVAFVPDANLTFPFEYMLWEDLREIEVKTSWTAAKLLLLGPRSSMLLESTKAIVGDIQRAAALLKGTKAEREAAPVLLLQDISTKCEACRLAVTPGHLTCAGCARHMVWPDSLAPTMQLANRYDVLIPDQFPDGSPTQAAAITQAVATLAVAAACHGEQDFLDRVLLWVDALTERRSHAVADFGELPSMTGVGDESNNAMIWNYAAELPSRLFA